MRKGPMHTFPKFRFVSSDIHVSYHGMSGTKDIIAARPQACRHDNFFPHENPWQKGIKGNISQEIGMGHKVPRRGKGSKPWNIQMNVIVILWKQRNKKTNKNRFGFKVIDQIQQVPSRTSSTNTTEKRPNKVRNTTNHTQDKNTCALCDFVLRRTHPKLHAPKQAHTDTHTNNPTRHSFIYIKARTLAPSNRIICDSKSLVAKIGPHNREAGLVAISSKSAK
jgi:hypothetical protein